VRALVMADVRFLRHLRDNNPNKTTLLRGRKVTAADALQARLSAAKEGNSAVLSKLSSILDYGNSTRARAEKSEKAFQWVAEAKRLEDVAQAEWKEMLSTVEALARRKSATDELAEDINDLWCEVQRCTADWGRDRLQLSASLVQVREVAAELGTDTSSSESRRRAGGSGKAATRGGGAKAALSARHAPRSTRDGASRVQNMMQVLQPRGLPAASSASREDVLAGRLRQLQDTRQAHERELSMLCAAQQEGQALVDESAKLVAELLAQEREEKQQAQDEQLQMMSTISVQVQVPPPSSSPPSLFSASLNPRPPPCPSWYRSPTCPTGALYHFGLRFGLRKPFWFTVPSARYRTVLVTAP
jgi:hypothetical protein